MIIRWKDNKKLYEMANGRIETLKELLQKATDNDDNVSAEMLRNAIEHVKTIKREAKRDEAEIWLDDDDRFCLGI